MRIVIIISDVGSNLLFSVSIRFWWLWWICLIYYHRRPENRISYHLLKIVEWECAEKHPNRSLPDKSTKFCKNIAYDMLQKINLWRKGLRIIFHLEISKIQHGGHVADMVSLILFLWQINRKFFFFNHWVFIPWHSKKIGFVTLGVQIWSWGGIFTHFLAWKGYF